MPGVTGCTPVVPACAEPTHVVTLRPREGQLQVAADVVREHEQPATYRNDFGKYAPDPAKLTALLARRP